MTYWLLFWHGYFTSMPPGYHSWLVANWIRKKKQTDECLQTFLGSWMRPKCTQIFVNWSGYTIGPPSVWPFLLAVNDNNCRKYFLFIIASQQFVFSDPFLNSFQAPGHKSWTNLSYFPLKRVASAAPRARGTPVSVSALFSEWQRGGAAVCNPDVGCALYERQNETDILAVIIFFSLFSSNLETWLENDCIPIWIVCVPVCTSYLFCCLTTEAGITWEHETSFIENRAILNVLYAVWAWIEEKQT